jgi:2-succinyl-6-hydroxy-2,4-cyclohexadiene-1-carboxylate synthase
LNVEVRGDGPPLVLLHGFTQTGRLWGPLGDRLAQDHTLVAIDLPGHAGSDGERADLAGTAQLVADAVAASIGTEEPALIGYSLGARVALHVLTATGLRPTKVALIGATGGIEDESARAARRDADTATADALEASGDVEGFIDRWLSGPMFERLADSAGGAERLRNTAAGLASSLRLCGTGTQEPLWTGLGEVDVPTLALAGADDARFAAHALRMARVMPQTVASLVPGGGHAVHLAQPLTVGRLLGHWFAGEQ